MNFKWTQKIADLGHPSSGALNLWNYPGFWLDHLGSCWYPRGKACSLIGPSEIDLLSASICLIQKVIALLWFLQKLQIGGGRITGNVTTPPLLTYWNLNTLGLCHAVGGCIWLSRLVPVYKNILITQLPSAFSWCASLSKAVCLLNAAVPRKRVIFSRLLTA